MTYLELQVALEVILEELSENVTTKRQTIYKNIIIPERIDVEEIDYVRFKQGIQLLIKQKEQMSEWNNVKQIIFKGLFVVYSNSNQEDRFYFFDKLLKYFYNKLVQKLIEGRQHADIVSLEAFLMLVRQMLPFVKLEVLRKVFSSQTYNSADIKIAVEEVYECIIYPKVLREDCYQIIKNKLKIKELVFSGFSLVESDVKRGICGDYYQLSIDVEEKNQVCTHNFFIKHIQSDADDMFTEIAMHFEKEHQFFDKFIPMLEKLGYTDVTDFGPKCYFSCKHFLVFEDLSKQSYKNLSIEDPLTQQQLSIIVEELSKLHACTFVFEQKLFQLLGYEVDIGKYFPKLVRESTVGRKLKSFQMTRTFIEGSFYLVQKYSKMRSVGKTNKITEMAIQIPDLIYDSLEPSEKYRNVINHGDLWVNNIMFSEDFSHCKLLDFASIRWCPPACDFLMLYLTNTDKTTRVSYGPQLLDKYYQIIKSLLNSQKISTTCLIPRQEYLEGFKEFQVSISLVALGYLQAKLLPDGVDPTGGDVTLIDHIINPNSRIKVLDKMWNQMKCLNKMEELIYDVIDSV